MFKKTNRKARRANFLYFNKTFISFKKTFGDDATRRIAKTSVK